MNKNSLLNIIATFSLGFGIIFCILPTFLHNWRAPATTTSLLFGIYLIYFGIKRYYHTLQTQLILKKLRSNDSSTWAHWHYNPQAVSLVYKTLIEERNNIFSHIILVMLFGLLIGIGFYFCNPIIGLYLALIVIILLTFSTVTLSFLVYHHYKFKLNTSSEAIITNEYIFFLENIYSFSTNYYPLETVLIDNHIPYSIEFTYSFYGTSLPFAPIVTIPIPYEALSLALEIQQKYCII